MASKQLYEDFYALLEAPEDDTLAGRDVDARPHKLETSPRQEDALEDEPISRIQQVLTREELLNELFAEINIDYDRKVPGLDRNTAILLIRSELEEIIRSDEITSFTKHVEQDLSFRMRSSAMDRREHRVSRSEATATQETLFLKGSLTFAQLPNIFLPGDIVYTVEPTPSKDIVYEQCWMVTECEFAAEGSQSAILLSGKKWCFDATSDNGWYLAAAEVLIYAYDGERRITVDDIGVVPLKALPTERQKTLSERLIARGRLYSELSQVKVQCWQYNGPACYVPRHWDRRLRSKEASAFKKLSPWMLWDSVIDERVVLNNLKPDRPILPSYAMSDSPVQTFGPNDSSNKSFDKMHLICSGSVFVRTLPDLAWVSVFIDHLEPVWWKDQELDQDALRITANLSLSHTGRERNQSVHASWIVILRTSVEFMSPAITAVADNANQPLVRLDLLDLIEYSGAYFEQLHQTFNYAKQIGAYLYLQNFAPLVAKRSYVDRIGCAEIRRFLNLIGSYNGVVFISLSKQDGIDPILDAKALVDLELHDLTAGDSQPKHQLVHFDKRVPRWDVKNGCLYGSNNYDSNNSVVERADPPMPHVVERRRSPRFDLPAPRHFRR